MATATRTAAALERVQELTNQYDLETIAEQAGGIVSDLRTIEESPLDLEELARQTDGITTDLFNIGENTTDLDALEEQADRVLGKLRAIAELLDRDDVREALNQE